MIEREKHEVFINNFICRNCRIFDRLLQLGNYRDLYLGGVKMSHEEQILICAVRHALGKMPCIDGGVAEYVAVKHRELSKECINIIIRDVEEELERYYDFDKKLGMEFDENSWVWLLKTLKREYEAVR